jgi:xanthine dehydrogenase YagR molybdenum-binding subunit
MSEETPKPGTAPKPWGKTQVIGKRVPRVDAYERVSGSAVYPSDVVFPDMLYGAILRCPWPNARVMSVDTSAAEKMEGVYGVISGRTPEADIYWPYSKEIRMKLFDPLCRYEGEPVAAVAATTPYQAWDAIRSIKVEYDRLLFVVDERKALDEGAARVHEIGNRVTPMQAYERGNVEKGFAEADVVLDEAYRTECEIHTPMELHAGA